MELNGMYAETVALCYGCGGYLGNCWCFTEAIGEAQKFERQLRRTSHRAHADEPRRPRPRRPPRRPARVVPVASYATAQRHYAGR